MQMIQENEDIKAQTTKSLFTAKLEDRTESYNQMNTSLEKQCNALFKQEEPSNPNSNKAAVQNTNKNSSQNLISDPRDTRQMKSPPK